MPLLGLLIDGIIDGIIDSIPENMAFISSMITMASLWAPIFYARFQKLPMPEPPAEDSCASFFSAASS